MVDILILLLLLYLQRLTLPVLGVALYQYRQTKMIFLSKVLKVTLCLESIILLFFVFFLQQSQLPLSEKVMLGAILIAIDASVLCASYYACVVLRFQQQAPCNSLEQWIKPVFWVFGCLLMVHTLYFSSGKDACSPQFESEIMLLFVAHALIYGSVLIYYARNSIELLRWYQYIVLITGGLWISAYMTLVMALFAFLGCGA